MDPLLMVKTAQVQKGTQPDLGQMGYGTGAGRNANIFPGLRREETSTDATAGVKKGHFTVGGSRAQSLPLHPRPLSVSHDYRDEGSSESQDSWR